MSRATYRHCKVCGDIHELREWPRECVEARSTLRSVLAAPMIISDSLSDVVNPIDGRPYDSKSAYYRKVRDSGCEIVGNETGPQTPMVPDTPGGVEADIATAIQQLGG